ncbi:type II secretion system minor pseudopilin GspI [Congregibacter brevis]|uniref:Type II secretion system protein I n=1 Tax=Congregibacter brevis TaxID=3081201 RepID=A0ABZ0IHW9_9GAMM|nr:type II secretion system minor pseudopilin GspI [Congregibacter sp. IMCC45268]
MSRRLANRSSGFTLIEVMVALAVVALAVPALLLTMDQQIDGTAYLRDRSLAQIVASNRLAELRLALRGGQQSLRGSSSGSEEMAGREWYWRVQSQGTEVPNFSRVEVQVRVIEGDESPSLYTLVAFIAARSDAANG